ncbi:MAG TPA: hypothetical protein VFA60_09875 [Terriglobales bacterium]|nr:hypothetical protein [Terriglobales bacterium]
MRKLYLPLTVIGIGGLGLLFATDAGRRGLRRLLVALERSPEALADFNQFAQNELDRIEAALKSVAESLESAQG